MSNYEIIYKGLKEFYSVNSDLLSDLERYSEEQTGRNLDENIRLYAEKYANSECFEDIKDGLTELNSEPHSISEMEIMYEIIDGFVFLRRKNS